MESIESAIKRYSERKANSELSLSEIRHELNKEGNFSAAEISKICRTISDNEMKGLKKEKVNPAVYLHHPAVAFVLLALFGYLVVVAYQRLEELWAIQEFGQVETKILIWRYFLLAGAIFFFGRNLFRVIKYFLKPKA